jgi:hypothetical protein
MDAPYCHLWPPWLDKILRHYPINGNIFGEKKSLNIKCVLWFSLQLLLKTFLTLRRIQRNIVINVKMSSSKNTRYSCQILIKFEFPRQIFKNAQISFHHNPFSGRRVVPCGQTDMTRLIVVFRNIANAPNNPPAHDKTGRPVRQKVNKFSLNRRKDKYVTKNVGHKIEWMNFNDSKS